ncbi:hypothetical protein HU200_067663 [Digitaria exilis]|uniref:Uncharacterized protein n=1 Tax=Digitaria exilis TaxID=1010633 RepID=A0A834ZW66_9POAL|nr:hypothetical protein HU200_067663 [Digitaria exilis]
MPSDDHGDGQQQTKEDKDDHLKRGFFDKSIGTAAGLSKLLPTGTTMAFQTMAPSFTRGGMCGEDDVINVAFTWWLIVFLTLLCAVLSFTDSVRGKDGHTYYYGIAMRKRLVLFNHDEDKRQELADALTSKKMGWKDFLHAFFSAAVFMTLAFCDAGVQRCLVRSESPEWKQLLANLPLAVGFLASFVFIVFPSDRNGIGVETAPHPHTAAAPPDGGQTPTATPRNAGEHNTAAAGSHDELDSVV